MALAGLDALALIAIGLGLPLLAAVAIWGTNYGFAVDFAGFYRSSALVWLLGHGVDVTFRVDPVLAAQLGLGQVGEPFRVNAAIGGFAVLSFAMAIRAGRRAALSFAPISALASLLAVTAGAALLITLSATSPLALPSRWQGVLWPVAIVGLGALIGGELERRALGQSTWLDQLATRIAWQQRVSGLLRRDLGASVRGGLAATMALIGLASAALALTTVLHYASVIGVNQALQAGLLGSMVLTVAQALLLPNLVLLSGSWLIGPGFAIGAGSTIAPGATVLGPVPALPLFGAIPAIGDWSLAVIAIPVMVSFVIAMLIRVRHDRFSSSAKFAVIARVAAGIAFVFAVLLTGLNLFFNGAVGPGALASFGPDPLTLVGAAFVESFVGALIGGYAGRLARRD